MFSFLIFKNKEKVPILSFQGNIVSIVASKIIGCKVFIRFNSHPENFIKNSLKKFFSNLFIKKSRWDNSQLSRNKGLFNKNFGIKSNLIRNEIDIAKIKKLSKKKLKLIFLKIKKEDYLFQLEDLIKNKNHYFIINALSRIEKRYKFNFLILGSGRLKNHLEKLIHNKNLEEFVKIIDFKKILIHIYRNRIPDIKFFF